MTQSTRTGLDEWQRVLDEGDVDVVSTDVFDTVLLRDHTLEAQRLAEAARRASARLGVDPRVLVPLRWSLQRTAYLAVAMERPAGEASLATITRITAEVLGLPPSAADVLREVEVDVDAEHLRPDAEVLSRLVGAGSRVIAVSDTYYGERDLRRLFGALLGAVPFAEVYSSADVGATKHAGGLYGVVARREGLAPERILHTGDLFSVDVRRAREAGWKAVHLPRGRSHRLRKVVGGALGFPTLVRRAW